MPQSSKLASSQKIENENNTQKQGKSQFFCNVGVKSQQFLMDFRRDAFSLLWKGLQCIIKTKALRVSYFSVSCISDQRVQIHPLNETKFNQTL